MFFWELGEPHFERLGQLQLFKVLSYLQKAFVVIEVLSQPSLSLIKLYLHFTLQRLPLYPNFHQSLKWYFVTLLRFLHHNQLRVFPPMPALIFQDPQGVPFCFYQLPNFFVLLLSIIQIRD